MPIVQRFFHQDMPGDAPDAGRPQPLINYFDKRVVVILGGPGMGKTTELEQAEAQETDSIVCTVSQFLQDPIERYLDKTIYLDALDEHRAELHKGASIINGIRGRLLELNCPKVRLSCRGEEWHQGSDVKSLSDVTGGEPLFILTMQPLSEENIRDIASEEINDIDAFLSGAKERQLEELLGNPETLMLYLKVYNKGGGWPETRAELMEQSTEILISEKSPGHERARGASISSERLMRAAEDLSAVLLFGDKKGAALSRTAGSDQYIPLQDLPNIDTEAANVAARRRLFSSDRPEQVHPQHKTTGDYLAAKALVRRIQDKSLPLGRALSLLTGNDERPLSHMRDVYAWLIALLPDHAVRLIEADPFGALIYGDSGQWSVPTRRTALKLLSAYAANNDPWFLAEAWYAPLLGGLVHPELVEDFRNILMEEPSLHVISAVLRALEYGKPLPELGDDLLSFVRDPGRPQRDRLRDDALSVFIRVCPDRIDDLKALLEDIKTGVVPDSDDELRAALLGELYPVEIIPRDVVHYFVEENINSVRGIDWFVSNELLDKTSDSDLPILADSILNNPDDIKKISKFNRRRLNGVLVRRLLGTRGDEVATSQIYAWLGIYMDRHHQAHLDKEDTKIIRAFFESSPELYVDLFRHWLDQTTPDEQHNYRFHLYAFHSRMLLAPPPPDFPETMLAWATAETQSDKAEFLFEEAAGMIMRGDVGAFSVSHDDLFDYVDENSAFTDIWEQMRSMEISDWQWEDARRKKAHQIRKERKRARNVEILLSRVEILRNGMDLENLDLSAQWWFSRDFGEENEGEPIEHIRQKTNEEITEAIIEGFEALLKRDSPQKPADVIELGLRGKQHLESYAVLAGADIVYARSQGDFLALPKANLKAALTYHLVYSLGSQTRNWNDKLMLERPELAREVLVEIWRAQLAGGKKEHLTGAYVGNTKDLTTPVILGAIYIVLEENTALPPSVLESFLEIVLRHGNPEVLRALASATIDERRVRGKAHTLWLSVAALLSPNDFAKNLDRKLNSNMSAAWAAHGILTAGAGTLMNGLKSVPQLQMSISILGKIFNNVPMFVGSRFGGGNHTDDAAQSIRGLIDTLSGLASEEAAKAFEMLIADPALHEWQDHLRHSRTAQAKNLRDSQFERPSTQDVCTLLAGGAPISMKDFQVLTVDILDDLAVDIRGGNDNKWKSFWTHAGRGALDKPKIENDSRDAMLPWMRAQLSTRSITIEPEGAAADQKRVDIRLTSAGTGTLPIEVKRDDNDELWTAMQDQLLERYTNDPITGGYGIYLVIWHGRDGNGCKSPPRELGIDKPTTATELWAALDTIKPDPCFVVRVIDVSKPQN